MNTLPPINERLIISVFDYTGNWAKPYIEAGYPVMLWDKKVEGDIFEGITTLQIQVEESGLNVHGMLYAPPCTAWAGSGAWTWPIKDAEGSCEREDNDGVFNSYTDEHKGFVLACLFLNQIFQPRFWALENPVGRIDKVVPELKSYRKMIFNPCDFGDPYTKKTILWGEFNHQLDKSPVEPIKFCNQGSWLMKLGGKSEKTKALRSITPAGFARSFFKANP